jgi:hypothetical protein
MNLRDGELIEGPCDIRVRRRAGIVDQWLQISERVGTRYSRRKPIFNQPTERALAPLLIMHERANVFTNVRGPEHSGHEGANAAC